MCRTTRQILGAALAAAGAGILLSLLLSGTFVSILLAAALIAGGVFLLQQA